MRDMQYEHVMLIWQHTRLPPSSPQAERVCQLVMITGIITAAAKPKVNPCNGTGGP